MAGTIDRALATEVLAGIISAPAAVAKETLAKLESGDFPDWRDVAIFDALEKVTFADHQEPGSVIVQVNSVLLNSGRFRDTDDGLRAAVVALAENRGHPEMLPSLVADLIEQRFRRATRDYATSITDHADRSPLADVDAALRGIDELRRLRARIPGTPRHLSTVKEGVA